jgi:hypothetical protein
MNEVTMQLVEANDKLQEANHKLNLAQREATAALNAANEAQRKFDAVVAGLRKNAVNGTDWASRKERVILTTVGGGGSAE